MLLMFKFTKITLTRIPLNENQYGKILRGPRVNTEHYVYQAAEQKYV